MKGRIFGLYSKDGSLSEDRLSSVKEYLIDNNLFITQEYKDNFCQFGFAQNEKLTQNNNFPIFICDGFIHNEKDFLTILNSLKDIKNLDQDTIFKKTISQLSGEYSFISYNNSAKILSISRDIFGTKPLYIFNDENEIIFGSEIKLIKRILNRELNINEEKLISFLCQFRKNKNDTFFEGVESSEPGLVTFFNRFSEKSLKKDLNVRNFHGSFEDAEQKLRIILSKSVNSTISDSEKTAILVSGGLDSASVLKNINHKKKENIKTFSMNFYDLRGNKILCDESEYQKVLTNEFEHENIIFTNESPFEKVDIWLKNFDQPFLLPNAYLYEKAYERFSKLNIKFVADGNGGDSVFSHGWERFGELFADFKFFKYFSEITKFSKLHNYAEYTNTNLVRKFTMSLIRRNFLINKVARKMNKILNRQSNRRTIIKSKFLKMIEYENIYEFSRNFNSHYDKVFNPIAESAFSALDILFFKFDIEQRSPLFNEDLVKLMLSFPSEYKLNNGKSRYILREAMKSIIPEKILERYSKSNLSENFRKNINQKDFQAIEKEINSMHHLLHKYLDIKVLKYEFEKFKSGSKNESTLMNIWNFYLVSRWLKIKQF